MYVTQEIAERIKLQAKLKGVAIKDLLADCDMNINAISQFSKGKQMSCTSLALVADYLDCSVDYLLAESLKRTVNLYSLWKKRNFFDCIAKQTLMGSLR